MARKQKTKIDKGTEVRRVARQLGLKPGATRVIPDKRKKLEKHKPDLLIERD